MPTRNTRYWRIFLHNLLSDEPPLDGVCVFTHTGHVEYRDGSFRASSCFPLAVDPTQILAIFDQLTRQAILDERNAHSAAPSSQQTTDDVTPALRLGDSTLHVVSATFTSACALSSRQSHGLVAERLPFGVLVVGFTSSPIALETAFAHVDSRCDELHCF